MATSTKQSIYYSLTTLLGVGLGFLAGTLFLYATTKNDLTTPTWAWIVAGFLILLGTYAGKLVGPIWWNFVYVRRKHWWRRL